LSVTWAGTINGKVSQTYNNNFRVASDSINSSSIINFQYDNDGLLTNAGNLTINRNSQNGLITGTTLGNVTDSKSYNSFGEVSRYSASYNSTGIYSSSFVYDKLGRMTEKAETVSGEAHTYNYDYDLLGQLKEVKKDGTVTSTYNYDSNGNRLSLVTESGTTTGSYDDQDRLLSYGNNTYTYTKNGELLTKANTTISETTLYVYDVLGNLKSVTLPNGTQIEYVIDGQNRHIGKKVNGTLTQGFLYLNSLKPIAELDGSNNVVSRFVYGTNGNVPDYMTKGGATYRIISDHLGSPRLVVNVSTGEIIQQIDYDEFGSVTNDTNPGFHPFGFANGLYDTDTKLVRVGLVNSRGRLQSIGSDIAVKYGKYLFEKDGRRYFRLTENVSISQEDIRQVQLAKAAIRAGIEILLTSHNLKPEDLKTVIIAGAFGYHLSKESLFGIGILPALKQAKFSFVGNSSLEGAVQALLNKKFVNDASRIARTVQVMELSQIPDFEGVFVKKMHFL
jgi:YD repeat-containing protein